MFTTDNMLPVIMGFMKADNAIKCMVADAGENLGTVAALMGKSSHYLRGMLSRGSVPKADTLASIADACGYELALIPKGQAPESAIRIDAPNG